MKDETKTTAVVAFALCASLALFASGFNLGKSMADDRWRKSIGGVVCPVVYPIEYANYAPTGLSSKQISDLDACWNNVLSEQAGK
jgi:hypothetical protein